MADLFDPEPSTLLCDESNGLCFDNLEVDAGFIDDNDDENPNKDINQSGPWSNALRSEPLIEFPAQSEQHFASLFDRERDYLPRQDYLSRLRFGDLALGSRREAIDWISKVHSYYNFGPLSLCLAVNYLDRFLSTCDLPKDQTWAVQLLALACLSIAAKMEETTVPLLIELQVGDPKCVFEAKTIERMELLVLDTLKWKMNAVTTCSFVEYYLKKLSDAHGGNFLSFANQVRNRAVQVILCTIKGMDFLEFRPSEIAAAVAMFVSAETLAVDIDKDKAISCFIHLKKDRVLKGLEMIKGMISPMMNRDYNVGFSISHSPIGVLESACFSYKSEELKTVGSCVNSSSHMTSTNTSTSSIISCTPEAKRPKLNLDTKKSTSGL